MKIKDLKKYSYILISAFILNGCNINTSMFENKIGAKCDDPSTIMLTERIFNNDYYFIRNNIENNVISKFRIIPDEIIEWDYKNNRYLCKAKISAEILDENKLKSSMLLINSIGINKNKENNNLEGWIYYQTFVSTTEMKKLKKHKSYNFYVYIVPSKNIPIW